jgi:hypothetical protein
MASEKDLDEISLSSLLSLPMVGQGERLRLDTSTALALLGRDMLLQETWVTLWLGTKDAHAFLSHDGWTLSWVIYALRGRVRPL